MQNKIIVRCRLPTGNALFLHSACESNLLTTALFMAAEFDIHAIIVVIFPASGTSAAAFQHRRPVGEVIYDS